MRTPSMTSGLLMSATTLLLGAGLGACTSTNAQRTHAVSQTAPARGVVMADTAYPRQSGRKRYAIERNSWGKTTTEYVESVFEPQNDGTWLVHIEENGQRARTNRLAQTASGVNLLESIEYGRNTHSYFLDGGVLMMPTQAEPEGLYGNSVTVEIYDLDNPGSIRERGTATRDLEYISDESITTPAGIFDAARVRSTLFMELRSASVERSSILWIDPSWGIVAEQEGMNVRMFGFPVQQETRLLRLAELPTNLRAPSSEPGEPIPGEMAPGELFEMLLGEEAQAQEQMPAEAPQPAATAQPSSQPVQTRQPAPSSGSGAGQMQRVR